MLSCEYCEIFKSSYFEEPLRTAASKIRQIRLGYFDLLKLCNTKKIRTPETVQLLLHYELEYDIEVSYPKHKLADNLHW